MKPLKNNNGITTPSMMAVIAVIVSVGALAVAMRTNVQFNSQAKEMGYKLDSLANLETDIMSSAQSTPSQAAEQPGTLNKSDNTMNDYGNTPVAAQSSEASSSQALAPMSPEASQVTVGQLFAVAPNIILNNVAGGGSIGKAWLVVFDGRTYLRVGAINLPAPAAGEAYQAWLLNSASPSDFVSAGPLQYDATSSQATLFFMADSDKSAYRKVVVTLGSTGADPNTANHIIEGIFAPDTSLTVTLDQIMSKAANGNTTGQNETGSTPGLTPSVTPSPAPSVAPSPAPLPSSTAQGTNQSMAQILKMLEQSKTGSTANTPAGGSSASQSLTDLLSQSKSGTGGASSQQAMLEQLLGGSSGGSGATSQSALLNALLNKNK